MDPSKTVLADMYRGAVARTLDVYRSSKKVVGKYNLDEFLGFKLTRYEKLECGYAKLDLIVNERMFFESIRTYAECVGQDPAVFRKRVEPITEKFWEMTVDQLLFNRDNRARLSGMDLSKTVMADMYRGAVARTLDVYRSSKEVVGKYNLDRLLRFKLTPDEKLERGYAELELIVNERMFFESMREYAKCVGRDPAVFRKRVEPITENFWEMTVDQLLK